MSGIWLYWAVNQPISAITAPQPSAKAIDQVQRRSSTVSRKEMVAMTVKLVAACLQTGNGSE